jgi:photosystem II stability/assembly factor-like uncharacterized protein
MRPFLLALLTTALVAPFASAGELCYFEDAALHAVQFVDDLEGWAVGDEGVIWHSTDGGQHWERQASGVRASLRSLHFLNPYVGWIVGREELPFGAGSAGVMLYTNTGGLRWERKTLNLTPGLNCIRFLDDKVGYAAGDGNDQFPSGLFVTRDGGRNWRLVSGPRCPGWNAIDFTPAGQGALVGAWNRLALLHRDAISLTNQEDLGGRNIRSLFLGKERGQRGVAVGQGSLILLTDSGGAHWGAPELRLPPEVIVSWDLNAVHGAGQHLWAAGRPGSVLLHSGDGGRNWEMQATGQPLPLNGLFFRDENNGWAVGDFGTILTTRDGGRSWRVSQQGGKRAALLFLHARSSAVPAEVLAQVGGDEGYLSVALRVLTPDPATASFDRAGEADRLRLAARLAGGAGGEALWQFPLAQHLDTSRRDDLLKAWATLHGDAADELLRQLVLAIRLWRPDVIVTDCANSGAAESVVAEAVGEAFTRAADPKAFPEQLRHFGLQPWKPAKVYGLSPDDKGPVSLDLTAVRPRLGGPVRDFAAPAAGLLAEAAVVPPRRRCLRLLASSLASAETHHSLMEGVKLGPAGECRRTARLSDEATPEMLKQFRIQNELRGLAETPLKALSNPDRLLAAVGPMLAKLPESQGAAAAHAIASQFVRQGQWFLAREAFLQMVERYPAHPLTADAYRWLIRHAASSETRRRHELGQFLVHKEFAILPPGALEDSTPGPSPQSGEGKKGRPGKHSAREIVQEAVARTRGEWAAGSASFNGLGARRLSMNTGDGPKDVHFTENRDAGETRRWHQASLELEKRLTAFGPLVSEDPSIQFCLHAARRNLGDFDTPRKWFADFSARQPPGPWRDAALAELWLSERRGLPPKPTVYCRKCETRPFLDGKFDDPCWRGVEPLTLKDAAEDPSRKNRHGQPQGVQPASKKVSALCAACPTKVWLTYDDKFLYLALRCEHPAERYQPPVKGRRHDADLTGHDRVSLYLDLDRDYSTCFHFEVDQRGCVREDCWGDPSWNPRWFVAVHSVPTCWQIEAAIPLVALTGDSITSGRTWACNVVRVVPGQGVQAWSLPAGTPEQPRLEGMGLLMFRLSDREEAVRRPTGPRMGRVP